MLGVFFGVFLLCRDMFGKALEMLINEGICDIVIKRVTALHPRSKLVILSFKDLNMWFSPDYRCVCIYSAYTGGLIQFAALLLNSSVYAELTCLYGRKLPHQGMRLMDFDCYFNV